MVKLTDRCFCCFTAAMLVPLGKAPTWRFYTKLYKFRWNIFPNNARMKNRTELNLGKVLYVWLIYHIPDSWLNSLNGYDFYFWLRDTANLPYIKYLFIYIFFSISFRIAVVSIVIKRLSFLLGMCQLNAIWGFEDMLSSAIFWQGTMSHSH